MGKRPRRSHLRRSFIAVMAAFGIGGGGLIAENLPRGGGGARTQAYAEPLSLSDQMWKNTLGFKTAQTLEQELITAAGAGDRWRVETLLGHGLGMEKLDIVRDGTFVIAGTEIPVQIKKNTPFPGSVVDAAGEKAALNGHNSIAVLLVDHGGMDAMQHGKTLTAAAVRGDHALLAYITARGAVADAQDGAPLMAAVERNDLFAAEILLMAGADAGRNESAPLRRAAAMGHEKIVTLLLAQKRFVQQDAPGQAGATGFTVEHETGLARASGEQPPALRATDVNAKDGEALRSAAGNSHLDIAAQLLKAGADPNAGGGVILYYAAVTNDMQMANLLLAHGANPDAGSGFARSFIEQLGSEEMKKLVSDYLGGHGKKVPNGPRP